MCLTPADLHLPTCWASEFLLNGQRPILCGKAVSFFSAMALFHFLLWLHCPTTFTSGDLVLVLCLSFKKVSPFPGLGYCHLCNPPFRLLAFQGSFLTTALALELPLLRLRKASLIISSRHWVAGQVMRTCSMCTPRWRPSHPSQQGLPSRYEFCLFLSQGCLCSWGIVWCSG